MKCPNCGLEVVIATDSCPQCGYRCEFDGSILPGAGPRAWEEEEAPPRRRERRAKRDEARWTEAGVFKDAAKGGPGRKKAKAAAGARPRAEAGMRWYNVVELALLPILCVLLFVRGVGSVFDSARAISSALRSPALPHMPMPLLGAWLALGIAEIGFGAWTLKAKRDMKELRRSGWRAFLAILAISSALRMAFDALWLAAYIGLEPLLIFRSAMNYACVLIFCALNAAYFIRRGGVLS